MRNVQVSYANMASTRKQSCTTDTPHPAPESCAPSRSPSSSLPRSLMVSIAFSKSANSNFSLLDILRVLPPPALAGGSTGADAAPSPFTGVEAVYEASSVSSLSGTTFDSPPLPACYGQVKAISMVNLVFKGNVAVHLSHPLVYFAYFRRRGAGGETP